MTDAEKHVLLTAILKELIRITNINFYTANNGLFIGRDWTASINSYEQSSVSGHSVGELLKEDRVYFAAYDLKTTLQRLGFQNDIKVTENYKRISFIIKDVHNIDQLKYMLGILRLK